MNHKKWYSSIKKSTKRREFIKRTWGAVFGRVRSSAFLLPPLTLRDDYRHYLWLKHFFSPLQYEGEKADGCFPSACWDCCLSETGMVEEQVLGLIPQCAFVFSRQVLQLFSMTQWHTLAKWQSTSCVCSWVVSLACFRHVINYTKPCDHPHTAGIGSTSKGICSPFSFNPWKKYVFMRKSK